MDASKYRLPDDTNGNGTKSHADTRRELLERRVALPPSPPSPRRGGNVDGNNHYHDSSLANRNEDIPPPPPPKDDLPSLNRTHSAIFVPGPASYFTPGHHRPGSIYTLSRASFASQLAQLTSLQLPDADSLSARISALQTAQIAARALIGAADQIKSWTTKAADVISGLDSDDDVEWAAAGGREGLADVENAITRFKKLIDAYVSAMDELQNRTDIADVAADDLRLAMAQLDAIIAEWSKIRLSLQDIKHQVEIAMEWEELWNVVLGDIQNEKDELIRLVFEMEERRHKSLLAAAAAGDGGVDIGDLENIIDDAPPRAAVAPHHKSSHRLSLPPFSLSPASPSTPTMTQDDSSLLALFARMQPLRASLDFLPMRLSAFEARARRTFPTTCDELEERRAGLDADYKQLERDAEALRKELGEDRWVLVFRGAGRQAQKMCESVERAVLKLREAVAARLDLTNQPLVAKKIESYDAKKTHYAPAIERIIGIIDKGVEDRLTVNGEILRLHREVRAQWERLQEQMRDTDIILEELQTNSPGPHLRDSFSSMVSVDRSTVASGNDTPGSSPPSSVIMPTIGLGPVTPKYKASNSRNSDRTGTATAGASTNRRSVIPFSTTSKIPQQKQTPSRVEKATHDKPWNLYVTNPSKITTGHIFPTPPSARSASSTTPTSATSRPWALRDPALEASPSSPDTEVSTPSRRSGSRLSFRERSAKVGQQTLAKTRLASTTIGSTWRASTIFPTNEADDGPVPTSRPASSLAVGNTRRHSLLPQPTSNDPSRSTTSFGRVSPALAGARHAMRQSTGSSSTAKELPLRPRWRP